MADYNIDILSASDGTPLLTDQNGDIRGVFYDSGTYRTITVSPFFGSCKDGVFPSKKASLMARYISWLTNSTEASIMVSTSSIYFGVNFLGYPGSYTLGIQNVGLNTLSINDIDISGNSFTLTCEDSYSLDFGNFCEIEVVFLASEAGDFNEEIVIQSSDTDHPTTTISVSATCSGSPVIYTPEIQYNFAANTNQEIEDQLVISNQGDFPLNYFLIISEELDSKVDSDLTIRRKSDISNHIKGQISGGNGYRGSGGPDNFGHTWIDSNEPDGPVYEFNDISTTGTVVTDWIPSAGYDPEDEGYSGPIDIGFGFSFYGELYNQIYIGSNGFLTFSPINALSDQNQEFPDAAFPNNVIAAFWDDLDGSSSGDVYYQYMQDRIIIQYTDWGFYGTTGNVTFQIHLKTNGEILYYYDNINGNSTSCTAGIENDDATDGLLTAYNTDYIQNNLAVKISAGVDWLEADSYGGILQPGETTIIPLSVNTSGISYGVYHSTISLISNDPEIPVKMIPVILSVTEDETFTLSLSISTSTGDSPDYAMISLENQNGNTDQNYYQISPDSGELQINYIFPGTYTLEIVSDDYEPFQETITISQDTEQNIVLNTVNSQDEHSEAYISSIICYPNPFNPVTNIAFSTKEEGRVTLDIYNLKGQKVRTLLNSILPADDHSVTWNGKDDGDNAVSSGVYFYQITSGRYTATKKMLLLK